MNSLDDVVSKLVQQQRRSIWSQVLCNQGNFVWCIGAFNDFLSGPGSVFVNTDHSEVGSNALQHREAGTQGTLLEELLNDLTYF
jgi:hypothetical protein